MILFWVSESGIKNLHFYYPKISSVIFFILENRSFFLIFQIMNRSARFCASFTVHDLYLNFSWPGLFSVRLNHIAFSDSNGDKPRIISH